MKDDEKENTPNVKKQGWSAREIIEQGANEESDEVVERMIHGDSSKETEEKRSLMDVIFPPNRSRRPGQIKRELSVLRSQLANLDRREK